MSYFFFLSFFCLYIKYTGHSGGIRSLTVFDNEQLFASGSKDKTVKLWSIGMDEDTIPYGKCRKTYVGHRKTVFSTQIIANSDLIASCDGSIHVSYRYIIL